LKGYPVQVTETSGYNHFQGRSFGGNRADNGNLVSTFRRRALSERNKLYVMFVLTPSAVMWVLLIFHLLLLCFEGVFLSFVRWNRQIWQNIYFSSMHNLFENFAFLNKLRCSVQEVRQCIFVDYFRPFSPIPRKLVMLIRYGIPKIK
jgi:hypothetical protein